MLKRIKNTLIVMLGIMTLVLVICLFFFYNNLREEKLKAIRQNEISKDTIDVIPEENKKLNFEILNADGTPVFKEVIYDGLTYEELVNKINRSLNSTIANMGSTYVDNCLNLGVDPYVAVAISLYETGCKWTCSTIVRECNNVGGLKGYPGCNGGSFKKYNTIEEGITSFIEVLAHNYYYKGLTTPELMEYKYASGSETWALRVNAYIDQIKAK